MSRFRLSSAHHAWLMERKYPFPTVPIRSKVNRLSEF